MMGIPTLIQEQNSYAGVTNKLLAQKACKICVAYELSLIHICRKLASVIVKARATQRIATIGEFLEIVKPLFGREREDVYKRQLILQRNERTS